MHFWRQPIRNHLPMRASCQVQQNGWLMGSQLIAAYSPSYSRSRIVNKWKWRCYIRRRCYTPRMWAWVMKYIYIYICKSLGLQICCCLCQSYIATVIYHCWSFLIAAYSPRIVYCCPRLGLWRNESDQSEHVIICRFVECGDESDAEVMWLIRNPY